MAYITASLSTISTTASKICNTAHCNMFHNKHVTIEFRSTIYSGVSNYTFGIGAGYDESPFSIL